MTPIERPQSATPPRGRRLAVPLAILLLVGLPLYLWPLRGGIQGLPGASALSGSPKDPRSAAAVAQLPPEVWDGLMAHGGGSARPKPPGNLTRISPHEDGNRRPGALAGVSSGDGGIVVPRLGAGSTPTISAMLADGDGSAGGTPTGPSGDTPASSDAGAVPSPTGEGFGGQGGNAGNGGYSPFAGNLGPSSGGGGPGGGNGVAPPILITDPDPSEPPVPTPEPSTLFLVGSTFTLIGALAWRRLRAREERKPSG